jgi:hypothetical protein
LHAKKAAGAMGICWSAQHTRCSWYPMFSVEFFAFASCAINCAIQILHFGALRRDLQEAMAAAGAAGGPGGAGPAPPGGGDGAAAGAGAPAPFPLTPALLSDLFLSYTLRNDIKLYYKAIKGLTNKFDLAPANMRKFLQDVFNKAQYVKWLMTFSIPVGNNHFDIIKEYGSVTLKDVALFVAAYVGTQTRHAPNSNQVYSCLLESLTPEAQNFGN